MKTHPKSFSIFDSRFSIGSCRSISPFGAAAPNRFEAEGRQSAKSSSERSEKPDIENRKSPHTPLLALLLTAALHAALYTALHTALHTALPAALPAALPVALPAGEARYVYLPVPPETLIAQIPPPPADDSPAGMADVETMLQLQKDRTPAQVERAARIAGHTAMQMGAKIFGPEFTAQNLPFTAEFLRAVTLERHEVLEIAKNKWDRVRPYDRGLGITLCVKRPRNTSYPSGHSAAAANWATIYSAMYPEYATRFEDEMREAMWCRVLGGAHYPSDTQAGKKLGILITEEMLKNPLTQTALQKARAEITAFLKTHPRRNYPKKSL
jgi:acid phosphatase (class A)